MSEMLYTSTYILNLRKGKTHNKILSFFLSTKPEKGPASIGSDPSGGACGKTPSAQEKACRTTEVSNNLSPSSSSGCTAEGSQPAATQEAEPITPQRRRELEHYLKLKSDGWLQDRSGQWVKDENVEFDSDEEEPPSLAPPPASH